MKRIGVSFISLVFLFSLSAVPACAQDKFVVGYGGGT